MVPDWLPYIVWTSFVLVAHIGSLMLVVGMAHANQARSTSPDVAADRAPAQRPAPEVDPRRVVEHRLATAAKSGQFYRKLGKDEQRAARPPAVPEPVESVPAQAERDPGDAVEESGVRTAPFASGAFVGHDGLWAAYRLRSRDADDGPAVSGTP